jgi:hypothetical protein
MLHPEKGKKLNVFLGCVCVCVRFQWNFAEMEEDNSRESSLFDLWSEL